MIDFFVKKLKIDTQKVNLGKLKVNNKEILNRARYYSNLREELLLKITGLVSGITPYR